VIDGEVARISTRGWWELGLSFAEVWLKDAQAESNPVAALPSLHAAFSLLAVVALWPLAARLGGSALGDAASLLIRAVLVLFPLAMAFTLAYGGEHYLVDVVAGWMYVVVVCTAARWWEQRVSPHIAAAERESVP
jgi:membrane-associated phospholipid phosphatase